MNSFEILSKARKNLEMSPDSPVSNFIVDVWDAGKNLYEKNQRLLVIVASLESDLASAYTANADYARNQDMLESRLRLYGVKSEPFDAAAFAAMAWNEVPK